ncbi:iron complex transport system permease protein [Scopulibacillus darangshiensis]|uniref:Iron complex transport system permease protein n=1 Tax=Scopulibacillus darangshiensis TaxID=442528 RepID=A0A4R2P8W0_9BACL|nr:iron ABC transporter permease [Scopulibacillus darangshiensis]TCP30634.1 iron complex transport system permease protein [Scopulibacillus darangshiensis]
MQGVFRSNLIKGCGLVIFMIIVLICMVASVILGLTHVNAAMVIDAYTHFDGSNQHIIIRQERVPRALIGASVGASLAIAGALMQGLTRNPLASPSILGVNAGASFFIVMAVTFFGMTSLSGFTWLAFLGAAAASAVVYGIGSLGREGLTPVKLTLAGAAIAALFSSLTQGMLSTNEKSLDTVLFWLVGSIQGRDLTLLLAVLPYLVIGWLVSLVISPKINTLMLGENVAKGLGQNTIIVKMVAGLVVVFLSGGSVAIAGPVGFIGIVIPHIARWFVGNDFRWLIPYSAMLGATLLLVADIAARFVVIPSEVPVGVMTAIVGTPFFIYLARKGDFK